MSETYLRDVLDLPESVHAGDFKIALTEGFKPDEVKARVSEYVVTDQLAEAFDDALTVVGTAVRGGNSYAAYLHGSFGSGKSHFLTVLHALLNDDPDARGKAGLAPVVAKHDAWLRGHRFLMIPYHLIGSADLDSALLAGYVKTVREQHPNAPVPPVYRSDAMLDDARRQRTFLADDVAFARWLGQESGALVAARADDLDVIDSHDSAPSAGWTTADLDAAFAAPPGSGPRKALESALLSGPLTSYDRAARGDIEAFVPLEDGLAIVSEHAKSLGYDGVVLFLDELILWLQAHMTEQAFVNTQVSKLVKLIESGVADRAVPIVSFISRQRDLSKLVGEDVTGADVKNLETQVEYLAERFDVVSLEDSNLPAIVRERVLRPRPGQEHRLDEAFAQAEPNRPGDRDVLLDATGVTGATWDDFRHVYPLSPALLNVLVVLSSALQRERTGLKLLQEMLHRRRDDLRLGELIPLADLWDVLTDGTGAAFTDRLRREAEAGRRFHEQVRAWLLERYGSETDPRFVSDERFVKTLLLASLAPEVPALARLTGARIAALNLGSIRSRTVEPGQLVVTRLRELQAQFGQLRSEGAQDPVFALALSDLDIEPLLDAVGEVDTLGARRIWIKERLWEAMGVTDQGAFVSERTHVWRGTRRTVELVFGNVRDPGDVPDLQFRPGVPDSVRIVVDYPFDEHGRYPSDDRQRVEALGRAGVDVATVAWIPLFLTEQRISQLGRLIKIHHLLERNRLDEYAAHLSSDDRARVRVQLQARRDTLSSQLTAALGQAYGINAPDEASVQTGLGEGGTPSLWRGHQARLLGGASFADNVAALADGLFAAMYPRHPDFDPAGTRKALTAGDLRTVLGWITKAGESGERRTEVVSKDLPLMRRVVHGLKLGEVADGPLHLHGDWRQRLEQLAAARGVTGDYPVDEMRTWIATTDVIGDGLPKALANLIVATYALLADRAWVHHGVPSERPDLERMGAGDALRAQELPSAAEFAQARVRAQKLFGVTVPEPLFARNVTQLAERVLTRVDELAGAVSAVWQALGRHAADLGIDGGGARIATARLAADLLADLGRHREPRALVRALARARSGPGDEVMGSTLVSAPDVSVALEHTDWDLLASVRGLVGSDVVGERAQRLVARVAEAAAAEQQRVDLVPALQAVRSEGIGLIAAAGRLLRPTSPEPPREPRVTESGPVTPPRDPASGIVRHQVTASTLEAALERLRNELTAHPERRYEVTWRVLDLGDGR